MKRQDKGKSQGPTIITVRIPVGSTVLEDARDAADALSGPPVRMTLNGLILDGIGREIVRLRKRFNKGKPFPKRCGALRPGRRVGR